MTTIRDVAGLAGVGVGTVSRVLNDHPAVSDETRAKVRDAMVELDYEPSSVARALSKQRSNAIAVVVPFFTHPSAVERLRGVVLALEASSYEIVLFNLDHADRRPERMARLMRRELADGLLVISLPPTPEELQRLVSRAMPMVAVDAEAEGFPTVVVDDLAGGRLAARHLLDLGHRRVGFVGDDVDPRFGFTSSAWRLRGFGAELAGDGVALERRLVRVGVHDRTRAHELARELLDGDRPPTAVFASSDVQAFGVLDAAEELGLSVPRDVSVLGFDDIETARYTGLSTVRQPLFESGRLGATMLLEQLDGAPVAPERVELPLEIVVRRTTGAARRPAPCRARGEPAGHPP